MDTFKKFLNFIARVKAICFFLERFKLVFHTLVHLAHGLFPSVKFLDKWATTTDEDHDSIGWKMRPKDYWDHLCMNLQEAVRHLVMAVIPFLDVKIKEKGK